MAQQGERPPISESSAAPPAAPPAACLALLALAAALPLLSLVVDGGYLAHPLSELPVKLWGHAEYADGRLFGGVVGDIGYPNVGPLNNPDLVTTLLLLPLRPIFGEVAAYNLIIWLQLFATAAATWALGRELSGDARAALTGAVAFALTPLVLVYCVVGAITDMLNLWPYPLALLFGLRALRREGWRDGLLAGAALGLGVATCPYNFVVFSVIGVPLLLWLPLGWGAGLIPRRVSAPQLRGRGPVARQWTRAVLGLALLLGLIGGSSVVALKSVMSDQSSQIFAAAVETTRHRPPYESLRSGRSDRYTAFAVDYVRVGKAGLIQRDLGSRYFRAFSPGLGVLALALMGLWGWRRRWRAVALWPATAVFGALASLGPFMPLDADHAFRAAVNPVWLGLHHAWPGADLLLEPFRYALVAALGLAMCATLGVAWLSRRLGAWVGWAAPPLVLLELVFVSPVPVPLPTWPIEVAPVYSELDALLPPGAVIELPYTWKGTAVFNRVHYVHQMVHDRPIPNVVVGFFPPYLVENAFTARLLFEESQATELALGHPDPRGFSGGAQRLVDDGFVAIIVTPELYEPRVYQRALQHLRTLPRPPIERDGRLIFPLVDPLVSPETKAPGAP